MTTWTPYRVVGCRRLSMWRLVGGWCTGRARRGLSVFGVWSGRFFSLNLTGQILNSNSKQRIGLIRRMSRFQGGCYFGRSDWSKWLIFGNMGFGDLTPNPSSLVPNWQEQPPSLPLHTPTTSCFLSFTSSRPPQLHLEVTRTRTVPAVADTRTRVPNGLSYYSLSLSRHLESHHTHYRACMHI